MSGMGVPSGIMWVLCWGGVFQAVCVGSYVGDGCAKRIYVGRMSGLSSELMWVLCRGVPSGIMWVLCWGGVFQAVCVGSYVGDACAKRIYVGRMSGGVKRIDVGLMSWGAK